MRFAEVHNQPVARVNAYLPDNYHATARIDGSVVISGEDRAGWTLDGYVIPRLASGLIFAREIPESEVQQSADNVFRLPGDGWDASGISD